MVHTRTCSTSIAMLSASSSTSSLVSKIVFRVWEFRVWWFRVQRCFLLLFKAFREVFWKGPRRVLGFYGVSWFRFFSEVQSLSERFFETGLWLRMVLSQTISVPILYMLERRASTVEIMVWARIPHACNWDPLGLGGGFNPGDATQSRKPLNPISKP